MTVLELAPVAPIRTIDDCACTVRAELALLLDRAAIFRVVTDIARRMLYVDAAVAAPVEGDVLVMRWTNGIENDVLTAMSVPKGKGVGGKAWSDLLPVTVADYCEADHITHDFDPFIRAAGIRAELAVPISRGNVVHGVLYVVEQRPRVFTVHEEHLLADLAAEAALAIDIADRCQEALSIAVHEERRRIAMQMHDRVAPLLYGMSAGVRDLSSASDRHPEVSRRIRFLERTAAAASRELREAMSALHQVPEEVSLSVAVWGDCRLFEQRTGVVARAVTIGQVPALDHLSVSALRDVVRQALLNVERHSMASSVTVTLCCVDGGAAVVIADNGVGLDQDAAIGADGLPLGGLGLSCAADRIHGVGGRLSLLTGDDGGVTVRAWVPWAS